MTLLEGDLQGSPTLSVQVGGVGTRLVWPQRRGRQGTLLGSREQVS